jgi:hypothetical protein
MHKLNAQVTGTLSVSRECRELLGIGEIVYVWMH